MDAALQGTRYGEALRNAERDEQAKRTRHERPSAEDWQALMCYVRQQVQAGAFERLMRKAQRSYVENNPYRLRVKHFEILDLGCARATFGQGAGQGKAMARLLECHLVEPVGDGLYAITERGRHIAEGGG